MAFIDKKVMMFEVTYKLKGVRYVMSYKVETTTAEEALKIADGFVKTECAC